MNTPPYLDDSLALTDRVDDLLARLSVSEKAGQLIQYFFPGADELSSPSPLVAKQADDIESAIAAGASGSVLFVSNASLANRLQRKAVEESRLKIPLLFGFDVVHGLRTIFPVPIALSATWSETTATAVQSVAAREARAVGIHWTFAPMVDVARDPRWGRIVEGAGEDPMLGAAMAAAQVRGFQGDLGDWSVLAGPKHLAGYGASRGGRDYDDAEVSDSELWNVYLPPFRAAVEAGAANVMSAYMDLNGVPAAGNRWLLTDVLRHELGFTGWVVSDANAVKSLEVQHFARDAKESAARALSAGLDMEMCFDAPAFAHVPEAIAEGLVRETDLDNAVRRVLAAKFALGLFEAPYVDEGSTNSILSAPEHRDIAREAAERSFVLLKNEGALLPLDESRVTSIAVIGELADSKRDTLGPWVFEHDTDETVTLLVGLTKRLARGSCNVGYAGGTRIPTRIHPSPFDATDSPPADSAMTDDARIADAVALAARSDVAVVVVGQLQDQIGEQASSSTLELPGRQLEQLQRIAATGTPVVLAVMSGRPLDLRWAHAHIPAIIQLWYPGTRGGEAAAAVLLGDVSPAGRLPFTWPRHVGQVPMIYSHLRTFAPQDQAKRYFSEESTPLYPFGHGLSYADFVYSNLKANTDSLKTGDTATISVDVTNTSTISADEVAQLYVHQRFGRSSRPVRELKRFERIALSPRETRNVQFAIGPDQLRYWSSSTKGYVQDPTVIDIWVGGSSDARLTMHLEIVE